MESINFLDAIALIVSAIVGAMGLGGGSVLILYLTMVRHLPQLMSQGINLLFFIPCAVTAVLIYAKQKIIQWKLVLPMVLGGSIGVAVGTFFLKNLDTKYITVLFAGFLLVIGTYTLFSKEKKV
ncbi:MAG: sulfite exporter TauE/SafE family protein [Candidatus Fimenecus sp.]